MNRPCIVFHGTIDNGFNRAIRPICQSMGVATLRVPYAGPEPLRSLHEVHLVWGLRHHPTIHQELAARGNVWAAENGWLMQKDGVYVDPQGPNGLSTLVGGIRKEPLTPGQHTQLTTFIAAVHQRAGTMAVADQGFIYAPLQVEGDTNIRFWSGCRAQPRRNLEWWVEQVCEAFPDYPIVFRPHPLYNKIVDDCRRLKAFTNHKQAVFDSSYSSYHWAARAHAVVGLNSTCLVEALSYYKPVFMLGKGVLSANGVVLEAYRQPERLREVLDHKPDRERINRMLWTLMERQIPYDVTPETAHNYPGLMAMIQCAINLPERPIRTMRWFGMLPGIDEARTTHELGRNIKSDDPELQKANWCSAMPSPEQVDQMADQGVQGVMFIDPIKPHLRELFLPSYKQVRRRRMELILAVMGEKWPENEGVLARVELAKQWTDQIALGNAAYEFAAKDGRGRANQLWELSRAWAFTWNCNVTPKSILEDIVKPDWPLRKYLLEKSVRCFCLSPYVLFAYLYWDARMPQIEDTTISGRNLHEEFGVTVDRVREWCEPLDIYAGAGWKTGLANGSMQYARELGFKGMLSSWPIYMDLAQQAVARPSRATYPALCTYKEIGSV